MSYPPLVLPSGWQTQGAPPPDFVPSADGSVFYGAQVKYNGGNYVYAVWWQKAGQVAQRVDSGTSGQGQFRSAGGSLRCVRYAESGEGKPIQVIEIPEFVPWPAAGGADPAQIAQIQQRLTAIETALGNLSSEGIEGVRTALRDWLLG